MAENLHISGADADESGIVESLIDEIDRFAAAKINAREIDKAKKIDRSILSGLAEMGLFGLSIPQEFGGAGLTLRGTCAVIAGLARHDRSVATTVGLHVGLGTRALISAGPRPLQEEILPVLAEGKQIAAFCATEPEAGSDLTGIRTRALPAGDGWKLDGTKIYVTNGNLADVFTVAAATPKPDGSRGGHAVFLVKRGENGVALGPEEDKLGLRGSSTCTLTLDGVEIPAGRLIGEPTQGMVRVNDALAWGRTAMAAGTVGSAKSALGKAVEYVKIRRQFNKTLSQLEVVQEQLAGAASTLFAMEALVRWVGSSGEGEGREIRSLAAKVFCSEGAWDIADLAVQLHGGSGFIEETGVSLILRDARVTRIFEGANDVLRIRLGLGWAARPTACGLAEAHPSDALALAADACWADARAISDEVAAKWGVRLALRHKELHRLGTVALQAQAAAAAAHRAISSGEAADRDLAAHAIATCHRRVAALTGPLLDGSAIAKRLVEA